MSSPYKRPVASAKLEAKRWNQSQSNAQRAYDRIHETHISDLDSARLGDIKAMRASTDKATAGNRAVHKANKAGAFYPALSASEAKTLGLPPLSSLGSTSQHRKVGGPIKLKSSLRM